MAEQVLSAELTKKIIEALEPFADRHYVEATPLDMQDDVHIVVKEQALYNAYWALKDLEKELNAIVSGKRGDIPTDQSDVPNNKNCPGP